MFAHLRHHIKFEDEQQYANKSKETEKVVLHVESTFPPSFVLKFVAKKKVPSKTNPYEKATKKPMKTKGGKRATRNIKPRWLVMDVEP